LTKHANPATIGAHSKIGENKMTQLWTVREDWEKDSKPWEKDTDEDVDEDAAPPLAVEMWEEDDDLEEIGEK
jgi:hypothetical protein